MPKIGSIDDDKVISPSTDEADISTQTHKEEQMDEHEKKINSKGAFNFEPIDRSSTASQSADSSESTPSSSASSSSEPSSIFPLSSTEILERSDVGKISSARCEKDNDRNSIEIEEMKHVDLTYESSIIDENTLMNDEIRARLDKLNALSDLINSLELQFDQANCLFREILKCSTDKLSLIAKRLGSRSLNHGRNYHAARITVEQSQAACQKACVQFEQDNHYHQSAREAIKEAEKRLRDIAGQSSIESSFHSVANFDAIDIEKLSLIDDPGKSIKDTSETLVSEKPYSTPCDRTIENKDLSPKQTEHKDLDIDLNLYKLKDATELSETLNAAMAMLVEAEQKRTQSEKMHLDRANKLMIAQENLQRLEREHGNSIRRSQLYFDEANRFKARLNSVKGDISRLSDRIVEAKRAYSATLRELEKFSDELHLSSAARRGIMHQTDG